MTKKLSIYHNKTSLQHLLRNQQHTEYLTIDKQNAIFNIFIYGFAYMNKLGNRSAVKQRSEA